MAANISDYHITIAYLSQVDHAVENMHGNNLEKKDLSARWNLSHSELPELNDDKLMSSVQKIWKLITFIMEVQLTCLKVLKAKSLSFN